MRSQSEGNPQQYLINVFVGRQLGDVEDQMMNRCLVTAAAAAAILADVSYKYYVLIAFLLNGKNQQR